MGSSLRTGSSRSVSLTNSDWGETVHAKEARLSMMLAEATQLLCHETIDFFTVEAGKSMTIEQATLHQLFPPFFHIGSDAGVGGVASCMDAPLEHANARSLLRSSPNDPMSAQGCTAGQTTGCTLVTRLLTSRSQFQERVRPGLHPVSLVAVGVNDAGDAGSNELAMVSDPEDSGARRSRTSATDVAARCTSFVLVVQVVSHVRMSSVRGDRGSLSLQRLPRRQRLTGPSSPLRHVQHTRGLGETAFVFMVLECCEALRQTHWGSAKHATCAERYYVSFCAILLHRIRPGRNNRCEVGSDPSACVQFCFIVFHLGEAIHVHAVISPFRLEQEAASALEAAIHQLRCHGSRK